jgi:heavy metal translocating P-type ATPase
MLKSILGGSADVRIAALALVALALSVAARVIPGVPPRVVDWPLLAALVVGGIPLLVDLWRRLLARQFGSDVLAGLAIVTAAILGQYVVAVLVILMLSGGQTLEYYATRRASAVLDALARRNPSVAHRRCGQELLDVPLGDVVVGDALVILPHEICPVDGLVAEGLSTMDESFLSGEPFLMRKTVGSAVISGAVNQDGALTITATRRAIDSRYARIMAIVRTAEERRPPMRRLADRLGAWYTPLAVGIALAGWMVSGDVARFLAVLVIATPCPLLLAIPTAIVGGIALSAKRNIVIKDPAVFERIGTCRTAIFDKTGTLTLGRPVLTDVFCRGGVERHEVIALAASLEQYSKHPLAPAVTEAADAEGVGRLPVAEVSELAGSGLRGRVGGRTVHITSRGQAGVVMPTDLPEAALGLECLIVVDGAVVALLRFRDAPRQESRSFVRHLEAKHGISRLILTSGDRESEVRYLGELVGIDDVMFNQSPEQKVALVTAESRRQPTLFVGDGLNDAPAMVAATVSVALGQRHEVTAESAAAVVLDGSLAKVNELLHIARRTKRLALQSAVGGMVLSLAGMGLAVCGLLPALVGAIAQEVIDAAAVLNALRAAFPPADLPDY